MIISLEAQTAAMNLHSFSFNALGTECILHIYAGSALEANAAAESTIDEIYRIEKRYSRYREDSVLSEINHAAARGENISVGEETAALLDYAFAIYRMSGGLFDITSGILRRAWDFTSDRPPIKDDVDALMPRIGMDKLEWVSPHLGFHRAGVELDFGGMGKEYAVDRAAAVLNASGINQGLVDFGGDIFVLGPHPDGTPWRIGIRDPGTPTEAIGVVELSAGALATSGDYERYIDYNGRRYGHILDPRTGWPAHGLSSVSVHARQCMVAGSLATIAILKGESGKAWMAELKFDHLWIDERGKKGGTLPLRLNHPD